ncbi:MAG: Lrp/AsnC family transcriptional regulator [Chitinispirillaceae bacterium]|nr:Lrp/AsnC family transcriptional regulator [Chitinispirillaceae bacterium]
MQRIERNLLNAVQRDFPLERRPFAALAKRHGITEKKCIETLRRLNDQGILRGIRPVIAWNRVGFTGILIGIEALPDRVDEVAAAINAIPGVTHNYLREGRFNLWCTLTYDGEEKKQRSLSFIRSLAGVLDLREFAAEKTYKIGLVLDV